ncbi:MAG: hypothetical protein KDB69_08645, partial [Acidimicrobiia bacterium]|nr:hypothetical protein [Acidimicrobiia bacterium]
MSDHPFDLLASVDPFSEDTDLPTGAMSAAAVLEQLEWRTAPMDTEPRTTQAQPTTTRIGGRKTPWALMLGAGGAAVAVLAVVVAINTGQPEDVPPVTSPPVTTVTSSTSSTTSTTSTTSAPPEAVGEEVAVAMVRAKNRGDLDAMMGYIAPGAALTQGEIFGVNDSTNVEEVRRLAEFGVAVGETYELSDCEGTESGAFTCTVAIDNDLFRGTGLAPITKTMRFRVADGQVIEWDELSPHVGGAEFVLVQFHTWHQENYPDDPDLVVPIGPGNTATAVWMAQPDRIELVATRIAEYLASLD